MLRQAARNTGMRITGNRLEKTINAFKFSVKKNSKKINFPVSKQELFICSTGFMKIRTKISKMRFYSRMNLWKTLCLG